MHWIDLKQTLEVAAQGGDGNPVVADVVYDSRQAGPGALFVAIPGMAQHGDTFIRDAVGRGAAAVISQNPQPECGVPWIQVHDTRRALGRCAIQVWNIDFDAMMTVGITGTNGKTTTVHFFHTLFGQAYGVEASWMFSTIVYKIGGLTEIAGRTTPEASDLLRHIGKAAQRPRAVSMEVSSHALQLHRVEGFMFDIAVWTNLTQDHLDFHKTMDAYFEAKKRLFQQHLKNDGVAVINTDDRWGKKLSEELPGINQITYGFSEKADMRITGSRTAWETTEIDVLFRRKPLHFTAHLPGHFNVYNMAALTAGALAKGISKQDIQNCFDVMRSVPGRMERVDIAAGFSVIVDYAHTPDALTNVLATCAKLTSGKVICVFGCGGDRDRAKRPLMAQAVAHQCDEAVITTDNPRTESPQKIIDDILEGMPLDFPHQAIPDRRAAIQKALTIARPGDCVIIAGKGHETYQEVHGVRHHFDDREVVVQLFNETGRADEHR